MRLVGWTKDEPGYIDNVRSTRVFPTSGIAIDNSAEVEEQLQRLANDRRARRARHRSQ